MAPIKEQILSILRKQVPHSVPHLLPGDWFYAQRVQLPDGIGPADTSAFAELSLEGSSPFLLEQLSWGFLRHQDSDAILIYAVPNHRLRREGVESIAPYHHVFPHFITIFGMEVSAPSIIAVASVGSLSAVYLKPGDPVPQRVISRPRPAEAESPAGLAELWREWRGTLPREGFAPASQVLSCHDAGETGAERLSFSLAPVVESGAMAEVFLHTLPLDEAGRWQADLRDAPFASRERKVRRQTARLWQAVRWGGSAAAVLLLAQFLVFATGLWNTMRRDRIARQTPWVTAIANDKSILDRIEQFARQELKPFAMLEVLNQERPNGIHFTRGVAGAWNNLRVDGEGNSVAEVNAYLDRLKALPTVHSLAIDRITSRGNKAPFAISVQFNPLPSLERTRAAAELAGADGMEASDQ